MTDFMYQQGIDLIKAMRDYDSFTANMLMSGCCLSYASSKHLLGIMADLGCVKLIGKFKVNGRGNVTGHYRVTPRAVTKLKAAKLESERLKTEKWEARKAARRVRREEGKPAAETPIEPPKKEKTDSLGEMVVVEKARVDGLGSPLLKHLDALLAGVRA